MKKCSKCGGPGPFNRRKDGADGLNSRCRVCTKARCDAWRRAHPEETRAHTKRGNKRKLEKNPEKYKELNRKYSLEWRRGHHELMLHKMARQRARIKDLPFNIERADVVIPTHCPLLGIPLRRHNDRARPDSPSLDRRIPSLGYVKGNVWVISRRANLIKNDATLEELELLTRNLRAATLGPFRA